MNKIFSWVVISTLWGIPAIAQQEKKDSLQQKTLKEVTIQTRTNGNSIDQMKASHTERLSQTELKKNACCNLAESFESNPSVEVSFSNAVSGARQIQMLGLSGVYVQLLTDVLPTVRGLNYTYGFTNIPGPMVHSIYINKGPGSVTNGFESMTGQIDVELMKPENAPRLHVNAYMNTFLRTELNINAAHRFNPRWSALLMTHASGIQHKVDRNSDGYLDIPLSRQLNAIQRWKYSGEKIEAMFGVKGLLDEKSGGQMNFNQFRSRHNQDAWGFGLRTQRWEAFWKSSYNFTDCGSKSLGLQFNFSNHQMNGFYGKSAYEGMQRSVFANIIYQTFIGTEDHQLRVGGGLLYDHVDEYFKTLNLHRNEPVTGLFAEYTYLNNEKWGLIAGVRGDYNIRLQRYFFIPRMNIRYALSKQSSLRASAGSGFRTATILAENAQLFVSNRNLHIHETLNPEYSWNYGINYSYCFTQRGKEGRFSLDVFRTDFANQIVADFDKNPQEVSFYNMKGPSYAWYVQAEWYYEVIKNLDIRLAYKFNDVRITQHGQLMERMLNAKHRALINASYGSKNKHWKFDFTTQWMGRQRLMDLGSNPEEYQLVQYSPSYFRLLGQITYLYKQFEWYMGSENMTNFIQQQVIVDGANPFGNYFDAGNVWGPTQGRMIYAGFRFTRK
jgi:outer membrane receptor for ferrienterochelin and colicins